MNIVKTGAPIAIDDLKKFFTDKTTFYVIDYAESKLKGTKLLTYLSNLDLPADVDFSSSSVEEIEELIAAYLNSSVMVNIPSLEKVTINIIKEAKGIIEPKFHTAFIENNKEILDKWISKLDSLTLYNMYIVKVDEFKKFAESFPEDQTQDTAGINFVNLLKHENFYITYSKIDKSKLKFYSKYFTEYMFKGKNLLSFWATENNPMFLLTFAIGNGLNTQEYLKAQQESFQGIQNVSPI